MKSSIFVGKKTALLLCIFALLSLLEVSGQDIIEPLQIAESMRLGNDTSETYEDFALSPDERYIAVDSGEYIEIWDLISQNLATTIHPFGDFKFGVFTWSPDSSQIATITIDTELSIWDVNTGELVQTLEGLDLSSFGTRSIEWHLPNTITTGSFEYLIWNLESDAPPQIVDCHPWGTHLWWSPNGEYIATIGWDSSLIWICNNEFEKLISIEGYKTVAWSPDSSEIATVGIYNTLRVWSVESGEALATSDGGDNNILSISWHTDGERIVTGHMNGEIRKWENLSPNAFWLIGNLSLPDLEDVAWLGNQLITTSSAGIQIWNVE